MEIYISSIILPKFMILVSACLLGKKVRYDGRGCPNQKVMALEKTEKVLAVCPEIEAGLGIPRGPFELSCGKVIGKDGRDYTAEFARGAEICLQKALKGNVKKAVLKQNSPSCGCGRVYDGTFSGRTVKGDGVFTALLKKNNIECVSEEEL
jgi:uncharacterized protein YbbK (DUF523 family)